MRRPPRRPRAHTSIALGGRLTKENGEMDDAEATQDIASLHRRLDAIDQALTKIHQWQSERPASGDVTARLDEILQTYGLTAQLVELWRKQRPEIQDLHRDVGKLHKAVAELEKVIGELHQAVKAVGEEERKQ